MLFPDGSLKVNCSDSGAGRGCKHKDGLLESSDARSGTFIGLPHRKGGRENSGEAPGQGLRIDADRRGPLIDLSRLAPSRSANRDQFGFCGAGGFGR